jgi:hypothetical protein
MLRTTPKALNADAQYGVDTHHEPVGREWNCLNRYLECLCLPGSICGVDLDYLVAFKLPKVVVIKVPPICPRILLKLCLCAHSSLFALRIGGSGF